jgi:AAA domain (dynein-related subfamily)
MKAHTYLNINELKEFLLCVAPNRPVFVWGPPGIGKSSVISQFATELGIECVPLLGSQLAPEDLIGIPQIQGKVSRFVPPSMIVRDNEYCLFIDELNIASPEVQKSFYSLILEKRVGEYYLPKGSIVIGAGNRSADSSLVRQMPAALINRMVHVHLKVDSRIWLDWAKNNDIHQAVIDYIQTRPSHLSTDIAPTDETPFSTPRAWHFVSDALKSFGENPPKVLLDALLYGSLTDNHATQFKAFIKQINYKFAVPKLINGDEPWPSDPKDRDILLFLVTSAKDYLIKELPKNEDDLTAAKKKMVVNLKNSLKSLSFIDNEYAQNIITPTESGDILPRWFLTEITKELPRLTVSKEKVK